MRARSPFFIRSEFGQTRFQCQRDLFLSSSSTQTHPAFVWRRFCVNTIHAFVTSHVDYCNAILTGAPKTTRQVTTSIKRCRKCRQWHQEAWPGTDAPGVTLAGHSQASEVQAEHAYPPVSAWQGTSVPIKLLHSSHPSRYTTTASTLHCTSSADRTSTSSQHVRAAGICCCWSNDVQRSARWSTRSRSQHNNIQTIDEDTPFLCLPAHLAH